MSNFRLTFSAVCAILPLSAQLLLWGFADAAYPREGTVTPCGLRPHGKCWMQLSPARGRLRRRYPLSCQNRTRCSLAPRGDGYDSAANLYQRIKKMQLSPARGRLRQQGKQRGNITRCSLAPRGDGYTPVDKSNARYCMMQLSPARGRLLRPGDVKLVKL